MTSQNGRPSLNALPSGTVLHDYVIDSELGSGGFSMVYLARHRLNTDWLFAIKEYFPRELVARDGDDGNVRPVNTEAEGAFEDGLRRFRDEAEQLRRFRNERYIVSCLNYFEANGTAYLVMDHDDGLPLSEFLRRREAAGQPFTEADLRAAVEPLLEGLEVVHRAGVLHRDIKPGNIFVRRPDDITGRPAQPVLIDFGAAKQNYLARHSRSQAPYTPGYAAYEQVSSMGELGPWTDMYALGALMWRMVAGGCQGDMRLHVSDDSVAGTVWNPAPRAVEKRSYALHSGQPDPMMSATELGAGRFSSNLLAAIDACLALIPEHRVQGCNELKQLIEGPEALEARNSKNGSQSESDTHSEGTPVKLPSEHGDIENNLRRADTTGAWNRTHQIWRTFTGRLKLYEQRRSMLSSRGEARKITEMPAVKRQNAASSRLLTTKTLRITGAILATVSVGAAIFLRVPLVPEQEGYRWESNPAVPGGASMVQDVAREYPRWVSNPLGAAMRQHGLLLNLTAFAGEQIAFENDPQFDPIEALLSEPYMSVEYINRETDWVAVLKRTSSRAEYDYLGRKRAQEIRDGRMLGFDSAGPLGIVAATVAVITDPSFFLTDAALLAFGVRRSIFSTRRAALWGAGIGALFCASIVAVHEAMLHIVQEYRTFDYSTASVLVGALLGGLALSIVGAVTSRRTFKSVAKIQDASIRAGAVCGLSTPILQLVFERLGLANDLTSIETLSLAFSTFVIVAICYLLLGSIRFFAKRREWIVWMVALAELQAHNIYYDDIGYLINVLGVPLIWMPSAFGLEILFRLFDNLDIPIVLRRTLQAVLLFLAGYLTWTVLGDFFDL